MNGPSQGQDERWDPLTNPTGPTRWSTRNPTDNFLSGSDIPWTFVRTRLAFPRSNLLPLAAARAPADISYFSVSSLSHSHASRLLQSLAPHSSVSSHFQSTSVSQSDLIKQIRFRTCQERPKSKAYLLPSFGVLDRFRWKFWEGDCISRISSQQLTLQVRFPLQELSKIWQNPSSPISFFFI